MKKTVSKKPKQFGASTLCRIIEDCLPEKFKEDADEHDMQELIDKLWPALVVEHEVEAESVSCFLEAEAPLYDDPNATDNKYCCEKTLLTERDRLHTLAGETDK